ncbi:polyamine ABC transporter ATP-binding protein [Mesorhizobium loti]|nr:polyamine ABC transporter ATP-binding protein [Mesorhizobium loti]
MVEKSIAKQSSEKRLVQTLTTRKVTKTYGSAHAVDAVDLAVHSGEFLTLLGPSGSGKTTLLMMIAGFVQPTSGDILLGDAPITNLLPERRNFGMVFQGYALFPHLSVADNVAFPLKARGISRSESEARVRKALAQVQLEHLAERLPRQLSGGQQQRVALARAVVFSPDLLLLDEPLSALDKRLRNDLQEELKQLHRQVGKTFINVTHDQEEALTMSDRIAIMRDGAVVQVGSPKALYDRPASRFVADFLGKSNFLDCAVTGIDNDVIRCTLGGRDFFQLAPDDALAVGDSTLLALRPERIEVHAAAPEGQPNSLTGEVRSVSYTGVNFHVVVRTAEAGDIMLTTPTWRAQVAPEIGNRLWISWPTDAAVAVAND